jgi:hypothetical protein
MKVIKSKERGDILLENNELYYIGDFSILLDADTNYLKVSAVTKFKNDIDIHPICDNTILVKAIDSRNKVIKKSKESEK